MKSAKALQDTWNLYCGKLPQCSTLDTNNRKQRAEALLIQFPPEKLKTAILKAKSSEHLLGISDPVFNPAITFDWFLNPTNVIATLEGTYDNPESRLRTPPDPGTIQQGVKWNTWRDEKGYLWAERR